jgi:pyrroloquinoline quinone biosynthesis protein D
MIGDDARPVLPRGVRLHFDAVRGAWTLVAPERAILLDDAGRAILAEVDGVRSIADIAARLAERFAAPVEEILADAREFLEGLADRRLVDLT